MRVLVAEDDRGLREVLVQGLEEAGYFVDAVAAGDEAIEQLRFYEYDVAVIDWRMPCARGLEVPGAPVNLTSTEFNILELLLRRSPAVVDRKSIAEHAWRDETQPLGSNAIDVQMSRLRAKLPNTGIQIVTVRGSGYRLEEA